MYLMELCVSEASGEGELKARGDVSRKVYFGLDFGAQHLNDEKPMLFSCSYIAMIFI